MSINYYLQPNPITPDPDDQSARVIARDVYDMEGIVKEMKKRGSSLTEPDMLSSANLMFEVMTDLVAEGNFINTPLANVRPSISGVFANAADGFDPSRHVKGASLSAGLLLSNKIRSARVEKVLQPVPTPVLVQFEDVASQTTGGKLTPGGIGKVSGEELKFDPANDAEGIFFIAEDGAESKATSVAQRTEGRLIFSIPGGLAAGQYQLEIRKGYKSGKEIRKGSLPEPLLVS